MQIPIIVVVIIINVITVMVTVPKLLPVFCRRALCSEAGSIEGFSHHTETQITQLSKHTVGDMDFC